MPTTRKNIEDLATKKPLLLFFLRHQGCTFCRQAISQIALVRSAIQQLGLQLVFVHMSKSPAGRSFIESYGFQDFIEISDPDCHLYQEFGLPKTTFMRLFKPKVLWRTGYALFFGKHGVGPIVGDPLQLFGAFLVEAKRVTELYRAETAADVPDFASILKNIKSRLAT